MKLKTVAKISKMIACHTVLCLKKRNKNETVLLLGDFLDAKTHSDNYRPDKMTTKTHSNNYLSD